MVCPRGVRKLTTRGSAAPLSDANFRRLRRQLFNIERGTARSPSVAQLNCQMVIRFSPSSPAKKIVNRCQTHILSAASIVQSLPMSLSRFLLVLLPILVLTGCVDISGRSAAQLTPIQSAQDSRFVREGRVYCILGWLGIWSRGMDAIAQRVDAELGVQAMSLANQEWTKLASFVRTEHEAGRWSGPLILVGHSIGADDQVRVAKRLNEGNIPVDLVILIDPTVPPVIPPNVKHCVNIFKSHPGLDTVPAFRGIRVRAANPAQTVVENIDLRLARVGFDTRAINHFNIAKIEGVQDMALAEIAKTCPAKKR